MKNRTQFLKQAITRTMITGLTYLLMPIAANIYFSFVGGSYVGYTILGSGLFVTCSLVLLIMSWVPVFDKEQREEYNDTFNN
jgi:hypothetical protein